MADAFMLVPGIAIAKERNVWKNEFKTCPVWMRSAILLICVYALGAMIAAVAFFRQTPEESIAPGAFLLAADASCLSILASTLWFGRVEYGELLRRCGVSVFAAALVGTVVVLAQLFHTP